MADTREDLPAPTRREVETHLDEWRVEYDVPGASVAVVDRDDRLFADGQGARDVETREPATADTRYPFASVSKVVTAMAVLQLVDRGAVALDSEIREYVSYWTDVPGEPITVGELLCHASGMPADYAGDRTFLFADDPPASPLATVEDVRRHVDGASDRRIVDGDRFMYSNRGYQVLGELVEAVDGRSFADVVEADLLAPLGMDRSTMGYGALAEIDDAITGYTVEDGTPTPTAFDLDAMRLDSPPAAGGLLAPVTDVARLLRCLLNGGELDGTRVLDADLVDAMCRHQAPKRRTIDGTATGCGYGPRVGEFMGEPVVWHTGTAPGVGRAYLGLLPERGLGTALGVNTAGVPIRALGHGLLAILAGETPTEVVPSLALRRKTRAVAGTYEGYRGGLTVTVEPADTGAGVEVTYEDGPGWTFRAFPESTAPEDYTFFTVRENGLRERLEFRESDDGMELLFNVDRLTRSPSGG